MQIVAKMGFALVLGLLGVSFLGKVAVLPISLVLLVGLFFFLKRKQGWKSLLAVSAALVAAYMGYQIYTQCCYLPAMALKGTTARVTAEVLDCHYTGNGFLYELRILPETGSELPKTKVKIYSRESLEVDYYDRISTDLSFEQEELDLVGVLGDYEKADDCFLFGTLQSPVIKEGSPSFRPLFYYTNHLRDAMSRSLNSVFDREDSALLKGILLGDTSQLSMQTRQQFRQAGISHVFSVSGLHLTLITQTFFTICGIFGIARRKVALGGCLFVILFAMVTGCSLSVIRSGIMLILYALGNFARRRSNGLNSLGIAGFLMSITNPYLIYDVGFLLSFSATLGILLFASPMTNKVMRKLHSQNKLVNISVSTFAVSFGATVGTLPIMLLNFKEISLIGLLVNPLLNIYLLLALVGGFFVAFTGMVPFLFPFAEFCGKIIHAVLTVITFTADRFTKIPFSCLPVGFPWVKYWVVIAIILLIFAIFFRKRKMVVRFVAILGCLLLFLGAGMSGMVRSSSIQVSVLRNGEQQAEIITCGGTTLVYGCEGDEYFYDTLRSYLRGRGIYTVDVFVQASESAKELERTADFCRSFTVDFLFVGGEVEQKAFVDAGGICEQIVSFLPKTAVEVEFGTLTLQEGACLLETPQWRVYLGDDVPQIPVDLCVTSQTDDRVLSSASAWKMALLAPAEEMREYGWIFLENQETLFLLIQDDIIQIV